MRNDKQVIERLLARKNGAKDGYKIGLIVEGGGMRGVFGGGVMVALESLGLSDCFDYIYGASSGSCSGAYLLAGQTQKGVSIYWEELNGFNFIRPWNLTKVMDLDYLFDTVMRKKKKLNVAKIRDSKTVFRVFLSDSETGAGLSYSNKDDVDFINLIKASCALPGFYSKPVVIKGIKHLDGRVCKAIPIEDALTDGCTDIFIITTVPEDYRRKSARELKSYIENILILPFSSQFKKSFKERESEYNASLDIACGVTKVHRKVNIYTIAPDHKISQIEMRRKVLKDTADHGTQKAKQAFIREKQK